MTLARRTTVGIVWNFLESLARRGVGIVVTLLLARFLAPEDFGLVAMMSVFLVLGTSLMESGFRQALIRMQEIAQVDFNTAFYGNIALGLIAYLILFLAAPWISEFYNESSLESLLRIASLVVLIESCQVVQRASLSRDLNFKAQLKVALPASIVSGAIAVLLALQGLGVWALVVQMLSSSFLQTILLWKVQGWRPSLSFSVTSLKAMYNFGCKLFLSRALDTIFKNLYVIVIAKLFEASVAGLYFLADQIKTLIVLQLVNSIQTVTFPALSSLQKSDVRLKEGYRKVISLMTFLLFPAMLFMAALAEPIFKVLLSEKWMSAVPYLQLLCVSSVLAPLHSVNLNIMKIKGRSDLYLRVTVIKKIHMTVILFLSVPYGIIGIIYGQILSSLISYFINAYYSGMLINYPIKEQLKDVVPTLALSSLVAMFGYLTTQRLLWDPLPAATFTGTIMLVSYLAGGFILKLDACDVAKKMLLNKLRAGAQ